MSTEYEQPWARPGRPAVSQRACREEATETWPSSPAPSTDRPLNATFPKGLGWGEGGGKTKMGRGTGRQNKRGRSSLRPARSQRMPGLAQVSLPTLTSGHQGLAAPTRIAPLVGRTKPQEESTRVPRKRPASPPRDGDCTVGASGSHFAKSNAGSGALQLGPRSQARQDPNVRLWSPHATTLIRNTLNRFQQKQTVKTFLN